MQRRTVQTMGAGVAAAVAGTLVAFAVTGGGAASSAPEPDAAADRPALGEPHVLHTFAGTGATTYGGAVSQLGDVDRDHVMDAVIGAPRVVDERGAIVGLVEVRSGRTGQLVHAWHGTARERFGYAVADAGDVDGDRVADVVVGAPGVAVLACIEVPRSGGIEVFSGRTGERILDVDGPVPGSQFGAAVASAGDVDRDGRGDLVVGAPCLDGPGGDAAGAVFVVSGRDGTVLREDHGTADGQNLGWGAGAVGDVNKDRRPEYVVGAPSIATEDAGSAVVYDGATGDRLHTLVGGEGSADLGWYFVGSAGDVDRDKRPDVFVGDFDAEGGAGQAYVFSGRTGERLYVWHGEPGDGMGTGRAAGDVDRDGYDDVVVGSWSSSAGVPGGGRWTLFSGRTGEALLDVSGVIVNENLGFDAVGIGDVDKDHTPDLLVSAASGDHVYVISPR